MHYTTAPLCLAVDVCFVFFVIHCVKGGRCVGQRKNYKVPMHCPLHEKYPIELSALQSALNDEFGWQTARQGGRGLLHSSNRSAGEQRFFLTSLTAPTDRFDIGRCMTSSRLDRNPVSWTAAWRKQIWCLVRRPKYALQLKGCATESEKYICCFMRMTRAINSIYKLTFFKCNPV